MAPTRRNQPHGRRPRQRAGGADHAVAPGAHAAAPGPRRRSAADPARLLAWEVLRAVRQRGAYANLMLAARLAGHQLTGPQAALATELVYGTLRGQGQYDAVIAACSDRDLDRIDEPVLDVLRLGAHQLLGTGIRPHAAVATSVDLARQVAGGRPAGFVNAVLRRVACHDLQSWIATVAPARSADLPGHLAIRYSHPRWLVGALATALGEDPAGELTETERALAADSVRPAVTLCAVPGLSSQDELAAAGAEPARWSPVGASLAGGNPGGIAAVAEGRASVQDEASQLAALALSRAGAGGGPDAAWLDLCAGPGGKARLLAGIAASRGATLVAAELRPHRARLVGSALRPFGGTAAAVAADGTRPAWLAGAFDRVLADVPCSGLGSLRRRPEIRWRRTPEDVAGLGGTQRRLLESAVDATRPGGIIAYVACSPLAAETVDIVAALQAARPDVRLLDAPGILPEVPDLGRPAPFGRCAQFWPHRHGTDAIFIALLRRDPGVA